MNEIKDLDVTHVNGTLTTAAQEGPDGHQARRARAPEQVEGREGDKTGASHSVPPKKILALTMCRSGAAGRRGGLAGDGGRDGCCRQHGQIPASPGAHRIAEELYHRSPGEVASITEMI